MNFWIKLASEQQWQPIRQEGTVWSSGTYTILARSPQPHFTITVEIRQYGFPQKPGSILGKELYRQERSIRTNDEGVGVILPPMLLTPGIWQVQCHDADLIAELFGEKKANTLVFQVQSELVLQEESLLPESPSSLVEGSVEASISTETLLSTSFPQKAQESPSSSASQLRCALLRDQLEGIPGEVLILRGQVAASGELDVQVFHGGRLIFQGKREVQFPPKTRMGVFGIPIPLPSAPWSGELTGKLTLRSQEQSADVTFSITCSDVKVGSLFEGSAADGLSVKKLQKLIPSAEKNPPIRRKVQRRASIAPFSLESFDQLQDEEAEPEPIPLDADPLPALQDTYEWILTPEISLEPPQSLDPDAFALSSPSEREVLLSAQPDILPELKIDSDISANQDSFVSLVSEESGSKVESALDRQDFPLDEIQPDEIQPDEIQPDEIQPDEIQPDEIQISSDPSEIGIPNPSSDLTIIEEDTDVEEDTKQKDSLGQETEIPLPDQPGSDSASEESPEIEIGIPSLPVRRSFSLAPLRSFIQPLTPSASLSEPSAENELPSPTIILPERLRAGDNIDVVLRVPCLEDTDTSPARPFWIKLWVKNAQTRSIVDGPRWILDFAKTDHGEWQSLTRMTIPHSITELIFEAWVISRDLQQQGSRTTLRRVIQ